MRHWVIPAFVRVLLEGQIDVKHIRLDLGDQGIVCVVRRRNIDKICFLRRFNFEAVVAVHDIHQILAVLFEVQVVLGQFARIDQVAKRLFVDRRVEIASLMNEVQDSGFSWKLSPSRLFILVWVDFDFIDTEICIASEW